MDLERTGWEAFIRSLSPRAHVCRYISVRHYVVQNTLSQQVSVVLVLMVVMVVVIRL